MEQEKISVGVITNHNKFDLDQYKAIKKAAKKKDIFVLPGVELSIKEGASSIHMLIVFDPEEWMVDGVDYISRNINAMFLGVGDPGNENTYTQNDLLTVIKTLDQQNKDYFMICAHVEQDKGFWKECGGTLIQSLTSERIFRRRVIGFQKARTRDLIRKVHDWMGYDLAFLEGSDPKTIENMLNTNLDCSNANGITVINEFTPKPAKVLAMVPLAYGILCELKKTVKEAETVKESKDSPVISIADKYSLSIQEAAEYYGIGEKRLRSIVAEHYNEPFILEIGSHQRIKRRLFEEFLDQATAV